MARQRGLHVPVLLMGYYNTFFRYGEQALLDDCLRVGVNGFIIVDLPPEESATFRDNCKRYGLSNIPLVAPITSDARLQMLCSEADSFIYVVSRMGVTGASRKLNPEIPKLLQRVRRFSGNVPLAVGFGVSTRDHFVQLQDLVDGIVIGSQIIITLRSAQPGQAASDVEEYCSAVTGRRLRRRGSDSSEESFGPPTPETPPELAVTTRRYSVAIHNIATDSVACAIDRLKEKYGEDKMVSESQIVFTNPFVSSVLSSSPNFGGRYAPELLMDYLAELESRLVHIKNDISFWNEYHSYSTLMGRPTPLYHAARLSQKCGGASIYLKREDQCFTGSYKIRNAMGQILLAQKLGKARVIAETGSGNHGLAVASMCARFGLDCVVYMGAKDVMRQALNAERIQSFGAKLVVVKSGAGTMRDAINEALRDWISNLDSTYYATGSACGPSPVPAVVKMFNSFIGEESKEQMRHYTGGLPSAVIASVGTGASAVGIFSAFLEHDNVDLVGVEAGGDGQDFHSARLSSGSAGVLHGAKTYVLQDENGQISDTFSIAAGLDYAGVCPDLATWKDEGRATFISVTDTEALDAFRTLRDEEEILPSLESAHAVSLAVRLAKTMKSDQSIVVCLSGSGEKDIDIVAEQFPRLRKSLSRHQRRLAREWKQIQRFC